MSLPTRLDRLDRRDRRLLLSAPPPAPTPLRLTSAVDVLALVEAAVQEAQADVAATPIERARTLGVLASVALKALEARDLEARVEALERVLKLRKEKR